MRKFLSATRDVDRSDTVSSNGNKILPPRATDDTAPILVPYGAGIWTFGDHLRHLAAHAGHIPLLSLTNSVAALSVSVAAFLR
jgi:hypothetical protein